MTNEIVSTNGRGDIMERVLIAGDIERLTADERVRYYSAVCESLGLNPLTKPFDYIKLSGKLVLYATRTAADQLRRRDSISISEPSIQFADGLVIVTVTGRDATGRTDSEFGAVPLSPNMAPDARANAIMKAITKAKRRLTLSMCGLGWLDETEIDTISDARPVTVNSDGVIVSEPVKALPTPQPQPRPQPQARPVEVVTTDATLADDELVIREADGLAFFPAAAEMLGVDVDHIKTRMRDLGYSRIKKDPAERITQYRKVKAAIKADAGTTFVVEQDAGQDDLFGEKVAVPADGLGGAFAE